MDDRARTTVSRLRDRAAYCRNLARVALAEAFAREFETIARDYERDAARLEATIRQPD